MFNLKGIAFARSISSDLSSGDEDDSFDKDSNFNSYILRYQYPYFDEMFNDGNEKGLEKRKLRGSKVHLQIGKRANRGWRRIFMQKLPNSFVR